MKRPRLSGGCCTSGRQRRSSAGSTAGCSSRRCSRGPLVTERAARERDGASAWRSRSAPSPVSKITRARRGQLGVRQKLPAAATVPLQERLHFYVWDQASGEVRWMTASRGRRRASDAFAQRWPRSCMGLTGARRRTITHRPTRTRHPSAGPVRSGPVQPTDAWRPATAKVGAEEPEGETAQTGTWEEGRGGRCSRLSRDRRRLLREDAAERRVVWTERGRLRRRGRRRGSEPRRRRSGSRSTLCSTIPSLSTAKSAEKPAAVPRASHPRSGARLAPPDPRVDLYDVLTHRSPMSRHITIVPARGLEPATPRDRDLNRARLSVSATPAWARSAPASRSTQKLTEARVAAGVCSG